MPGTLLRSVRIVPIDPDRLAPTPEAVFDVRWGAGRVRQVAPRLTPNRDEVVLDGDGRWLIPGLWDAHVHPVMWGLARRRIDLTGTTSPDEALDRVRAALDGRPKGLVLGFGHRSGLWRRHPTVADLDAVAGGRPVALVSGDAHNGWLSSAAYGLIGLRPRAGLLVEDEWYPAYARLEEIASAEENPEAALRDGLDTAATLGVVGIVDVEFGSGWQAWPGRCATWCPPVRVRAATYSHGLDEVAARGLRTGEPLAAGSDLVTMGPLKVIGDGSLNTLTAWCREAYAPACSTHPRGRPNQTPAELTRLLTRAKEIGLAAAVHAIGDAAVTATLDAFEASGQRGSIEHVQLVGPVDLTRMARLGLTASVQPAHLLDDREVIERMWADRADRAYAFRSMRSAGVALALGSDAPVSPLDPWLAMAAAVHRSAGERAPWHPEQRLTVAEALASSVDGHGTVRAGSPADLALLDADPYATEAGSYEAAEHLQGIRVGLTVVDGRVTHSALG